MKITTLFPALVLGALMMTPAMAQYSSPMRDVDNPARQPFNYQVSVVMFYGTSTAVFASDTGFKVPSGKRAVIEMVTVETFLPSGQHPRFYVGSTSGGVAAAHKIPLTFAYSYLNGASNYGAYESQVLTRIYADASSSLSLNLGRDGSSGTAADVVASVTLSGYYVNLP